MKIILVLISLLISILVIGQDNDIIINTNRPLLKRFDIDLFSEPNKIGFNELDYEIDRIIIGNVRIYFYSEDTICFRIKNDLPIMISGLKNLQDGKIKISKIPRVKYNSIDSLWSSTVSYYDKDSLDLSTTNTTIYVSNDSPNNEIELKNIRINGMNYSPEIIEILSEFEATYCTPGEFSTTQYVRKIDKFFHYVIRKN